MRKLPCAVSSVSTLPHMEKETCFLKNCTVVLIFLDDFPFIRPENLKNNL